MEAARDEAVAVLMNEFGAKDRAPRRMLVALSPASEKLVRRVADATRIPLAELLAEISASPKLAETVTAVLRARHSAWRQAQDQSDIFTEAKE